MASLCYLEAFRAKRSGTITEEEYIHHLLAHTTGVMHDTDEDYRPGDEPKSVKEIPKVDPFAYGIRCWVRRMPYSVKDATPFEAVFTAFRAGPVDGVKAKLAVLDDKHVGDIRKSLALYALQHRRADVLKLCLDQRGFAYEHYFEDEADRVDPKTDPETFKVLEESHFRQLYPRLTGPPDDGYDPDGSYHPERVFDRGGKYPVNW